MPDYAGAVAAIKDRMDDGFTALPVAYQNEAPPQSPWPPVDGAGLAAGWVYFEVIGNGAARRATGRPGSQLWLYEGHILAHVFAPPLVGTAAADAHAVAIGELFRGKAFYRDEAAGAEVRTEAPWQDGGERDPENGNYYRVTTTVPFRFFYRG